MNVVIMLGLWVYDDGPNKMYTSLRANTCKILMAFPEYPMLKNGQNLSLR